VQMLTEGMQQLGAAVGCSTFSDIMLAMLAKLFWPSLLSLTKLPAKDWGPSLLFLLDLCISSTLCRHRRAMSEGYLHANVTEKAASKRLFLLDLWISNTLCRHSLQPCQKDVHVKMSLTKLPAKDWGPSLLFLLDLCINSTLCRHSRAMSEGCLCELVADKAASKGLRAQPAVLAVSLHQQHSLQTQHRQTTSAMNTVASQ